MSKLQASLEELFAAPALLYAVAGDEWAVNHVTVNAPVMAEAWVKLAQESPPVKRFLDKITTGTAWGGVIVATGGFVLPLLAHHQMLPAPIGAVMGRGGESEPRGPIVPPPPAPDDSGMTPPVGNGQPPGVVTVAGTGAVT